MAKDPKLTGLISKTDILKVLPARKLADVYCSVPKRLEPGYLEDGWSIVRRNKTTCRLSKPKQPGQAFEDEVWALLAAMGFDEMNEGRDFCMPVSRDGEGVPPKQIDVFAKDDCAALIVECKQCAQPTRRSLQKDIAELSDLRSALIGAVRMHYGRAQKLKVALVIATRNIIWSDNDLERANAAKLFVLRDDEVDYYAQHAAHIGAAARFQFLADVFAGQKIPGLELSVPSLRGKMSGKVFYAFVLEPAQLLRIAFVSHRAKADKEFVVSYQRMLKKKRLKEVEAFIENKGIFPTSVVVNLRSEHVQFYKKSDEAGSGSDFGILHLPSSYKSAWIIDGQHRLYGYARSPWSTKATLPVIAFENLTAAEEARMFVDINNKQVKVPRNLLVELAADLHWDSPDPDSQMEALISRIASALGTQLESPLKDRMIAEGDKQSPERPITLTTVYEAIRRSGLLGTVTKGCLHPGPLYDYDAQSSLKRASVILSGYLSLFSDALPSHWGLGSAEGGYLCTNNGIAALFLLLTALVDHLGRHSPIDPKQMSPEDLLTHLESFCLPVIRYFETAGPGDIKSLRKLFGYGGQRRAGYELMEIVHNDVDTFCPSGLDEHMKSKDMAGTEQARLLMPEIQLLIRDITLRRLKTVFDSSPDEWWWSGVPTAIRTEVAQRQQSSPERGELEAFFELIDYKKIVASRWLDFQKLMSFGTTSRSKDEQLGWFDRLNKLRNRIAHPERGGITDEEVQFLLDVKAHLERALSVTGEGLQED